MVLSPLKFSFFKTVTRDERLKFYCAIFNIGSVELLSKYFVAAIMIISFPAASIYSREVLPYVNGYISWMPTFLILFSMFIGFVFIQYFIVLNTIFRLYVKAKYKEYIKFKGNN